MPKNYRLEYGQNTAQWFALFGLEWVAAFAQDATVTAGCSSAPFPETVIAACWIGQTSISREPQLGKGCEVMYTLFSLNPWDCGELCHRDHGSRLLVPGQQGTKDQRCVWKCLFPFRMSGAR